MDCGKELSLIVNVSIPSYIDPNVAYMKNLSPSTSRKNVARSICCGLVFLQCFLVLSNSKHCFQHQNMFLVKGKNMFCCWKQCFLCGKTGKQRENMCTETRKFSSVQRTSKTFFNTRKEILYPQAAM